MFISLVLPTYNEAENLEKLVMAVDGIFKKNSWAGEILIVDDNSPDGTGKIADRLQKGYPVVPVHREKKEGLGKAYAEGISRAKGGLILMMDADFSHDPEDIPRIVKMIEEGHDMAIGSRYCSGGTVVGKPFYKIVISKVANRLSNLLLGLPFYDTTDSFRVCRKEIFEDMTFESGGNAFLTEITIKAYRKGYKICECPIRFVERRSGRSKLSLHREIIRYLAMIKRTRRIKS